jgi:hypothetical protein
MRRLSADVITTIGIAIIAIGVVILLIATATEAPR